MLSIRNHVIGEERGELSVHVRLLEGKDPGPPGGLVLIVDQASLHLWELY